MGITYIVNTNFLAPPSGIPFVFSMVRAIIGDQFSQARSLQGNRIAGGFHFSKRVKARREVRGSNANCVPVL